MSSRTESLDARFDAGFDAKAVVMRLHRAVSCAGGAGTPARRLATLAPGFAVMDTVFFESTGERHAQVIGGMRGLERRIRAAAAQGALRAVVAAAPVALPRPLPIPVEFVAVVSAPPAG